MLLQDAAPNGAPSEPRNATHSQLCCRVQCVVVQEDQVSLNDMRMWCLGAVLGTASTSPARGPLLALSKFWGARAHAHAQGVDRRLGANVRGATTGTASSDSSRTVLDVKDRRDSGRRNVDTEQRRGGELQRACGQGRPLGAGACAQVSEHVVLSFLEFAAEKTLSCGDHDVSESAATADSHLSRADLESTTV